MTPVPSPCRVSAQRDAHGNTTGDEGDLTSEPGLHEVEPCLSKAANSKGGPGGYTFQDEEEESTGGEEGEGLTLEAPPAAAWSPADNPPPEDGAEGTSQGSGAHERTKPGFGDSCCEAKREEEEAQRPFAQCRPGPLWFDVREEVARSGSHCFQVVLGRSGSRVERR